ncbi:MAG: cell division protein FtsA [Pyramidobacter sp.]|nr:cell division protein FtsA [Pyramidobacter sp.]
MGRDSDILVGLDLGTSKITVTVAELAEDNPGEAQIIGIGQAPSRGMLKGKIVNLEQAISSVSDAIADAESMLSGIKISRAVVAYSCPEARCYHVKGMISLGRAARQITREDLERVIETALSNIKLEPNWAVIHTLPIKYAIDDIGGIDSPLDMTGMKLEVELTAITVPVTIGQNVVNCVRKAGVKVTGLILKPLAEALGALSPDERAIGASLISIGGGTTSFTVFYEGRLMHASELAVGGDHVSNDISLLLKIPITYAEKMKKELSAAPDETPSGIITLDIRGQKQEIDKAEAADIAAARLEQLFADNIAPGIEALENKGISTEIVMNGGVMLTPGIKALAESHLKRDIRIGTPVLGSEMPEGRNDCRYCAAAGIIVYLTERRKNPFAYVEPPMTVFKFDVSKDEGIKKPVRKSDSKVKTLLRWGKDVMKELF